MFPASLRLVPDEQLPPFLGPLHGLPMFSASLRLVPDEQRRDPACGGCAEISGRVIHAALALSSAGDDASGLSLGGWEVGLTRPSSEAAFVQFEIAEPGQLPVDGRTRQLLSLPNARLLLIR